MVKEEKMKGKTAWITGGKRIGKEVALALAGLGANLVITYRSSKKEAEETAKKARSLGVKTLVIQADVSERSGVNDAVRLVKEKFGRIDILVLLASVFKPVKLENVIEKDWDSNFSVHIKGTFWPVQASLPLMKPGSHIVMVSDRTAIGRVYPGFLPYVVTKSGVAAMTRALAVEVGSKGIFVNAIAPGPILKPDDINEKEWREIRASSIVKYRITDKEAVQEFVDMVIRLCFVRSSGSVYPLDLGHL